jgi:hypothetical protein
MKWVAFRADSETENPIIGDDPCYVALDMGEAADEGRAVLRLEFLELAAVHDARNHFVYVVNPT